jgi:hypothetical protein
VTLADNTDHADRRELTMHEFSYPTKPQPGDRAAVLSPSAGPAVFPAVFELGLRRLRDDVVTGLDIGHTDPQLVIPNGGKVTVDAPAQRIFVSY